MTIGYVGLDISQAHVHWCLMPTDDTATGMRWIVANTQVGADDLINRLTEVMAHQ